MLAEDFYEQSTPDVAQQLIGCVLVHHTPEGICSGIIVETEAYLKDDPASHTFRGKTPRNAPMFGPPGRAYIYQIYGLHYCFNITANQQGVGEAVLVRALKPLEGISLMQKRRGILPIENLCNGPAKLVKALGISKEENGLSLNSSHLYILPRSILNPSIITSTRIGVSQGIELPLRFMLKNCQFVSRPLRLRALTVTHQPESFKNSDESYSTNDAPEQAS